MSGYQASTCHSLAPVVACVEAEIERLPKALIHPEPIGLAGLADVGGLPAAVRAGEVPRAVAPEKVNTGVLNRT